MVLIDLGELEPAGEQPVAPTGRAALGGEPALHPTARSGRWQRWLPLLGWVPAMLLTAAAPRAETPFVRLADTAYEGLHYIAALTDDVVVLSDRRSATVYGHDGRVRWRVQAPQDSGISLHGEALIIRVYGTGARTESYGLANGRKLWSIPGGAEPFGDVVAAYESSTEELAVYDNSGQDLRWQATGVIAQSLDRTTGTILALDREGRLTEREPRTGAVIRAVQLSLPRSHINMVTREAETVTVYNRGVGAPNGKHTIVDRRSFTVTGSSPGPAMPPPIGYSCGEVRCEMDPVRMKSSVLDSESGRLLWQAEGWYGLVGTAAGILGYPQFRSGRVEAPMWLAAPRTGERLRTIEAWYPIREDDFRVMAPVLLSFVHTDGTNGRTLLAGFDKDGLKMLGSVPHVMSQCRYLPGRLACLTGDHRLLVLQLHPRWR